MSTRAIKKLTKKDDLKELEKLHKLAISKEATVTDSEEASNDEEANLTPINKFNLLDELSDTINEKESDPEITQTTVDTKSKSKKKKKSNKKSNKSESSDFQYVSSNVNEELDDDQLIAQALSNKQDSSNKNSYSRKLFQIEAKFLNAENEMIRMFGAKIVQSEKANQKGNRRGNSKLIFKINSIVSKKSTWPEFYRHGLSMKMIETSNDAIEFAFEHSKDYQHIQFAFIDAVESLDHNNIINVLHLCPFHIDSLIQLSDISRMSDDTQMAADLIERTLYAIQNCFHPSFNFISKSGNQTPLNYKIDYNRVENRGFFIALFKHILYVGGKACYRTSLELCKLLLSLDVENDPLGCILLIDFYAIRSNQYEYLIEFYEEFNVSKSLHLLPNIAMSVALAYFNLFNQKNDTNYLEKGEKLLQDALVRFPSILMDLLEKCSVVPDKQVESHWIFAKVSHLKVPQGLKYLIDLYVTRMHYEWKIAENIHWLEKNVKIIISKEKSLQSLINENKKKCKSLFANVPTNLYRHLILSDLKEVAAHLPAEFSSTATYTFDPIPPKNSIISYTKPKRTLTANTNIQSNRAEALLTFFQSLLPSFNAQDPNHGQELEEGAAAAAAAAPIDGANNRFDMQNMVGRLRDFLTQIEQNFPAAPPNHNEGGNNEDNNNDNNDDHVEEFD